MSTIIREIGMGGKTLVSPLSGIAEAARGAALPLLIAASAILPARGDDLAITPATLPVATQMVAYAQTFTASGGSGSYNWSIVPWTCETAEPTYSVGANETPLWDGTAMKGNTAYKLPFTFTYCGTQYDTIYVDSHGFLLFDPDYSSSDYAHTSYLSYGYTGLAVLWKNYAQASGWVDTSVDGQVSFRFEVFYESGDTTNTWAHKTTLYSDGRIRFAYRQSAGDSIPDNFAIGLAVGNMRGGYSYASLPLAGDGDPIPSNDYVFKTYGIPEGFYFESSYYDYSTYQYVPRFYGQSTKHGQVPFALKVTDGNDGTAVTNFYDFVIVENPDKEPVIDAVTPATTNDFHRLSVGDTMDFHVDAHDLADGPFDINWVFYRSDSQYSASTNIGTGADFTFTATRELYDFQYSSGESVLKCIVSDAFWTNTVTWHVSIRRDTYIDFCAAEGGNGTAASPYNNLRDDYLKFGDKIIIAPGRYELDYMNLGSKELQFVSTGTMDDTTIAFTSGYSLSGNYGARASFTGFTFENVQGASYVNFTNCSLSGIQDRDYGIQDCDLTGCYVWGCSVSRNLFTDCTLADCTVAGNEITTTEDEYDNLGAIGARCHMVNTIVVNNLADDGSEANFNTDEWSAREMSATNCCTIPAMTSYGTGNFEAHPSFVYATMGDLRLRAGSACLADNPANNTGAYKGPGVEGFTVHAFTDPVRGIFSDGSELQIVASNETAWVSVKPLTDRAFLGWVTNGVEVAGATEMEFAIENIDCDYEVEALFEYREFWVNPTETDDSGDGTAAAPKKTIAAAAALALDGETIHLAEGTFEPFAFEDSYWNGESYVSDTRALTFLGAGAGKTIIDGGGTNTCARLTSTMTLKNASLVNGTPKNYAGGGFCGGTIESCVVSNCMSTSRYTCYGAVYNATVVNSLIVNNVNTNSTSGGRAAGVSNCKVYNSTIANNVSTGYPGGANYSHLKNCIVYGNTARSGYSEYNEVRSCQNEALSTGVSVDIAAQSNLIGVDPWFVDAANGDWRLTAGSPAIDVGEEVTTYEMPFYDLSGEPSRRIKNNIIDYGCYEGGVVTGAPVAPVATGTSAKAGKGLPFVWSAVPNAAEYRIYRGTVNDAASATQVGTTTATNYLDLATTGGTDYFYWVSAWNSQFGESEKCGPIAVTSYADLKIETASLPAATEAVPYSVQLECSGNVGAATWSLPYTVYTREANTFDGSVGTAMETPFSSEYYGCCYVEFPFTFNWFGAGYTAVTVSTRGGIYFGKTTEWLSWGSTSLSSDMPKIAVLEGVSGSGDYSTITGVSVATNGDNSVTIVCTGTYGGYSSHPAEFSVTFYPDNSVRLAYGEDCIYGGYVAWSNGSDDTKTSVYRTRDISFAGMDDIVITSLLNESHLALSEDGLLSGVEDYAGTYRVTALVTDTDNGDVAYKTYTLTVNANANARPVIDATSPATGGSQSPATITKVVVPEGDSQTFAIAAHDPEGTALSYKWYLDDALVASGTNYTFTATELSRHTLTCEVSDALWTNGQVYAEWEIAVGKKFYVDAVNGTTNGTGTAGSPFKTINAALDEAISYEASTILVAPGTYGQSYLNGGWYSGGPTIVVRSTGSAADTFIDGNGRSPCVANYCFHDGFTFEGFTLRNGYADDYWTPSRGGGGSFMVNLKNCVVYNCTAEGAGGGVFGASIDHCTIYGCSAGTGGGIDATSTAINSIVWGNTATNAGATAAANYETGAQFENCCTTPLPEGANIAEDPQFVNAAGGDFRLADTSPCLAPGMGCFTTGGGAPVGVTYTVTFNANGGTCAEATRTVAKGKAVGTLPQATRPGYTLKGWYTAKTSGTKITASTTVTKDVTYYAQWTETPKYTVTFDANGGTCATKTRQVYQSAAIGELPEATRDGYTLDGWFTAKTGGSRSVATDIITKNITLYARWTEVYELVIDENGVLTGLTGTTPAALDVPATVTAFAADLFKGVTKITSATGGAGVTKCGAGAFRDSGIWAAAPNGPVVVCGVLVGYKGTVPATLDVPNGVRVIADGALAGATTLATVYLPDSLVAIGDGAFRGCTKLDDVIGLEPGVTVAADAFEGTLHATFRLTYDSSGTTVIGFKGPMPDDLVIPAKVTAIAVDAFNGKATMTSVTLEGTNDVSIGANAFKNSTTLKTVSVGGSTTIGASAFLNCTALTNADFGAISSIGASAFEGCSSLAAIELPESLDRIGAAAFKGCVSFTAVHLPASLTVMGEYTFAGCTSLATITGGEGVRDIRTDAFAGTPWYEAPPAGEVYEEMVLGHVLVKIKGNGPAFYEISTNITMVASEAFSGQTTLRELYIGTEVFALWDRAFAGCASLGSVTVPSGCREFGDYLFDGCSSLTNVIFRGHAPTNDVPHVFAGTPESLTVHVKAGSRGWIAPESESTNCPAYWPVNGQPSRRMYCPTAQEYVAFAGGGYSIIVDGVISNDTTWAGGKVYEIQRGVRVEKGATLTIEEGAIVKLPLYDAWRCDDLRVYGKLVVNGTYANPVVFTSIRDDSWGGDTNGDGSRSEPYPGEAHGVNIDGGGIEARYAKFLYGNATGGHGAHACLMSYNKEYSTLYGCEFSHSAMDGCFISGARLENCIFTDCDRGLVSCSSSGPGCPVAINCVAYGNRIGFCSHDINIYVTNSIAAFNSEFGIGNAGAVVHSTRCCLYNPGGQNDVLARDVWFGSLVAHGKDNIEADPLFLDPENGDFRISVESPCVDAAYGEVAPMNDFYEQPRMDVKYVRNTGSPNAAGEYPDIGIYEVPGTTERPVMNLEVENVAIVANGASSQLPIAIAPGETFTVSYTVRNTGNTAAKGSIRDVVRIKSAVNGGTMTAGTVTQNYNLQAAETAALHATVTMPAAPAGEWLVGIDVNPNRDVFEQNFLKNSMWTEDAVEVTLQEMTAGSVWSANVPAGTTMGYVLADVPAEGGVVVITGGSPSSATAIPVIARVAAGHMPTVVMNDATSFVRAADGAIVLVVPPHAAGDQVYLALENTGVSAETVNVSVQELTTELWSVYPLSAANVGEMGFTFTGAGLKADSGYYLGNIPAKSVTVLDSANVFAVFDVQNIPADRYYDIKAAGITMREVIRIDKVAKGPILEAKLELPERTRDNRVYTGYVVYENKGDTQMNAPMFVVSRDEIRNAGYTETDTRTLLGQYDANVLTSNAVLIAGIGSTHPAGILKPGDSGRLPFKFKPLQRYNIKLDKWATTRSDVAEMATRLNLRGRVNWNGNDIYYSALNVRNGNPVAGVSGWLLDSRTREPLEGVSLRIVSTNTVATTTTGAAWDGDGEDVDGEVEVPVAAGSTLKTDENGYFQFTLLEDGVYRIESADKSRLVSDVIVEVAGQKDVNGLEVMALPAGRIYGYVYDDSGAPVAYATLSLGIDDAKSMVTTQTDGFGAYSFDGLWDGNYAVEAERSGVIGAGSLDGIEINATNLTARADLVLPVRAMVTGMVTCGGVPLTFGSVRVTEIGEALDEGEMSDQREMAQHVVEVDTNGQWIAEGVLPGRCRFTFEADGYATSSNDLEKVWQIQPGEGNVVGIEAVPAPIFKALLATGFIDESKGEKFKTAFCATEEDTNVVSYAWHIFSDGDAVGQSITTTNDTIVCEFEHVGQYHATLTETRGDGTTRTCTIGNVVEVREAIETKYRENAIVISTELRHNAGTLQYVDADVNADGTEAEPGTRLRLTGAADIPLDGAVIMFGFESEDEEGEVSVEGGIRRVLSYTTDGDTVTCVTEAASLYDVYAQFAEAKLFEVGGEEETQSGASLHAARPRLLNAPAPATRGAKGAAKKVGEFANSLFQKSSEMTRKLSAHAVNGLKLIGEGTPTGIGCRIHEVSNKAIYLHKIYVDVRDYDLERMEPDMSMSQGVGGFRLVRIKASYTNNVCQQTCRVKVDFEPYVTVDGQIAAGWEKRTDKCEVKIGKPFAVKVGVVPLGRWQFIAQLRPYLNGNLRGKVDLGIRFKGRCDYTANFVDGRIFWTDPEFSIDKVSMIAYPTIRNIKIHGGGLDAGMGGAFGIRLESISFLDLVAGLEAQARFNITKDVGVPTTMEMGASVNAILECQLKDTTFFGHVMARCPLFKLSASLWNLCGWRWTAARSQFDWYQDFSAKGKRRIVYENWSDRAIKEELTRKHFLVGFSEWRTTQTYPFNKFRWRFGDNEPIREYAGSGQNAPTDIRCDYKKAGKYNVWLDAYSGPADFAGDSCTKEVTVEENPEDENEETKEEKKEEPVDQKITLTQVSCDPNALEGPEGVGEERFVKPGQKMNYTIYFENKSDAAISAQEVFVENGLSEYLDWSTFEMGTVSVGGQIDSKLDGYTAAQIAEATNKGTPLASEMDQTNGLYKTRTEVRFDAATGVASWYIRVLDPKKRGTGNGERGTDGGECWPDDDTAGVLQPNLLPPEGEGYITYTVNVSSNAPANAIIDNSADIVFDKNPVIVTDPAWWNTVYGGGAEFIEPEVEVDEGSNVVVRVVGGNESKASSVKVYLTYNTASAADLNLGKTTYPITLKWAKGEIGEKTVTIPVKRDALYEGDEMFTLQLAGASGLALGERKICTVTIKDANAETMPSGAVAFEGGYYVVSKGNATAKALPGYVFVAWVYNANGKTYSTKATITDKERKAKKVRPKFALAAYVRALVDDPATGSVKGQGKYAIGKMVPLTATAKSGYAFTGWRDADGNLVSLELAFKYTLGKDGGTLVASFKKESALARPVLKLTDASGTTSAQTASGNDRTISVGVTYPATLKVAGESKVSITKVTGLPTGLTYKSGKISGIPTKAGKFTASVTVTLASNKKKTWICKIPIKVIALPEWARGTFTGTVTTALGAAKATMAVGTTGKISGKFALGGTNWTFSASSFAKDSVVTGEVVRFKAAMTATGTWKVLNARTKKYDTKTTKMPMGFTLVADPETSAIASRTEGGYFGSDDEATEENEAGTVEFRRDAGISIKKGGETGGGTVSLSVALGQAASNKTVKATAKLNKGYAFTGWWVVDGATSNRVSLSTSYTRTMLGEDVFLLATFKKESAIRPSLLWNGEVYPGISATNLTMGVQYVAKLAMESEASVKISKVTGIPTGTSSFKSGVLTVIPTKAGKYPVTVTAALATNAKKTWTYKVTLVVTALPAYAKGTYNGVVMGTGNGDATEGLATVTVGATGKISGKFYENGTNWTLSAACYTARPESAPYLGGTFICSNLVAKYSWTEKKDTKSVTRRFVLCIDKRRVEDDAPWQDEGGGSSSRGYAEANEVVTAGEPPATPSIVTAWQNLWTTKNYAALGKALFFTSKAKPYREYNSVSAENLSTYDTLALKVSTNGAVTATYKFFKGTFVATTKAPQYATYTCTTVVVPTAPPVDGEGAVNAEGFTGHVHVFFPPVAATGFPGYAGRVAYPFVERVVPVPEQSEGGSSWFTGEFNGYGDAQFPIAGGGTEFLNGLFTINVASDLSFTGTFTGTDGTNAPFSGTFAKDGSSYVATGVSITVKGKTMSMGLMCDPGPYAGSGEGFGEIGGGSEDVQDEPCIALNCAWQNIWTRTDLAAEWKPAFASGTEKTINLADSFLDNLSDGDSLTYSFGANGAVTVTGKIYGEDVNVTAKLNMEGCDSNDNTMHCNMQFLANGHLYQQQFTFPRQATVEAANISLAASDFNRLD